MKKKIISIFLFRRMDMEIHQQTITSREIGKKYKTKIEESAVKIFKAYKLYYDENGAIRTDLTGQFGINIYEACGRQIMNQLGIPGTTSSSNACATIENIITSIEIPNVRKGFTPDLPVVFDHNEQGEGLPSNYYEVSAN